MFAGLWGLAGVAAGASFDHLLADRMTHAVETALRYHQTYALVIAALGLTLSFGSPEPRARNILTLAATIFAIGSVIFSGSLYAAPLTGIAALNYGAPAGGMLLMAGWAALVVAALKVR